MYRAVGHSFAKERGKWGGGGKYASVGLVIGHEQAASVGLLGVKQLPPGHALLCCPVTLATLPALAEEPVPCSNTGRHRPQGPVQARTRNSFLLLVS